MVDFFWNVGAPETEIDRLNDVGAMINPIQIGSWIDMSAKGGMDGGWFFPVDVPMKFALKSSDDGDPIKRVEDWAEANAILRCTYDTLPIIAPTSAYPLLVPLVATWVLPPRVRLRSASPSLVTVLKIS